MPVTRVKDLEDMPSVSLRCAAAGRHVGFFEDPLVSTVSVGGWGNRDAREVTCRCDCGRTKREVIDWDTGETLTRSAAYDGGTLPSTPSTPHDARLVLLHRIVDARLRVQAIDDASTIGQGKTALADHRKNGAGRRRKTTKGTA